jgi:hypothetical protein
MTYTLKVSVIFFEWLNPDFVGIAKPPSGPTAVPGVQIFEDPPSFAKGITS